ncbi:polysaccharide biosynthesis tyrosine autokinase [Nocardioides sp. CGMCC 1.13656]|nr:MULTISPECIES: polysaccharide biosynthesis tyrosine autokinase [unclassified Nocardioides]MBA2954564.1 polysaccharide biosynthesis tyrosine autokinase [Nocardioides sp. CGMCC 1.13656]
MELRDYLRILRAHWVGVTVITLASVAIAGVYTLSQPKIYAANANGFVSSGQTTDPALASVNDTLAKSRAKSYVDIATSRATAQRVIDDLGLDASPAGLIGDISVEQPIDTVLLKITAKATSPQEAQALADAWVRALASQVDTIENPKGGPTEVVKIVPVEAAALPSAPVSPRPNLNLLIGLLAGLLLGFGYAMVRNQLDRRLRSATEIEREFGVPVAGTVPATRVVEQANGRAALTVVDGAGERAAAPAEAYRKLRTNLAYMDVDNPPRVIVVSSPHQSDGKSTIAANLAAAIALSGESVTLVDGDLRRPMVANSFGLVEGAGLTDVLVGNVGIDDVLQEHHDYERLRVLAAGSIPPNPSELLGSKAMRATLEKLASDSIVIIDAPPLLPVTDAAVLTTHADGALVVISHGRTLDTELKAALGHVYAVQGKVLGVILNRVPRSDTESGYYGGYYYRRTEEATGLARLRERLTRA